MTFGFTTLSSQHVFITILNIMILLPKHIFVIIKIVYFYKKEKNLYTNEIDHIIRINIFKNVKIVVVVIKNIYSIFCLLKSKIKLIQN